MVKYHKWQDTIQLEMSYSQHWSVTVAITASRWTGPTDTQPVLTAWRQTYDGINRRHHVFDCVIRWHTDTWGMASNLLCHVDSSLQHDIKHFMLFMTWHVIIASNKCCIHVASLFVGKKWLHKNLLHGIKRVIFRVPNILSRDATDDISTKALTLK